MPSTRDTAPGAWTGLFAAVFATVGWFFLVAATELVNDAFFAALAIGSGVMFLAGVLLTLSARTRLLGIGFVIGAPVAFVIEVAVLAALIVNSTY